MQLGHEHSARACTFQTAASAKELEQYHSEAQIWLDLLEEEVKQGENLKEEDFQENKVSHKHAGGNNGPCTCLNNARVQDCEEVAVKDLLMKGENLQKRVPDEDKREKLRLKHNQLNSKYNTVKVAHTRAHTLHTTAFVPQIHSAFL